MNPAWDWKNVGFLTAPVARLAGPRERLFRIWGLWDGGGSAMFGKPASVGVCFTTVEPTSRMDAERLLAVFEWGNPATYVTEFVAPLGTELWVGEVHPGNPRALLGTQFGEQVFVENPAAQRLIPLRTKRLQSGLGRNWYHPKGSRARDA